jgi:hypothetical protein
VQIEGRLGKKHILKAQLETSPCSKIVKEKGGHLAETLEIAYNEVGKMESGAGTRNPSQLHSDQHNRTELCLPPEGCGTLHIPHIAASDGVRRIHADCHSLRFFVMAKCRGCRIWMLAAFQGTNLVSTGCLIILSDQQVRRVVSREALQTGLWRCELT